MREIREREGGGGVGVASAAAAMAGVGAGGKACACSDIVSFLFACLYVPGVVDDWDGLY